MDASEAAETIEFVKEIIAEEGRPVTLVKFNTAPTDPTKPHLVGRGDPFNAPLATQVVNACFVPISSLQELGMSASKRELYTQAAVVGLMEPTNEIDYAEFNGLIDGTARYILASVDRLKPGAFTFLWSFAGAVRNAS